MHTSIHVEKSKTLVRMRREKQTNTHTHKEGYLHSDDGRYAGRHKTGVFSFFILVPRNKSSHTKLCCFDRAYIRRGECHRRRLKRPSSRLILPLAALCSARKISRKRLCCTTTRRNSSTPLASSARHCWRKALQQRTRKRTTRLSPRDSMTSAFCWDRKR